jgi:hypothetical protein
LRPRASVLGIDADHERFGFRVQSDLLTVRRVGALAYREPDIEDANSSLRERSRE